MTFAEDIPHGVLAHEERLICRYLDGEIRPDEQAELDRILTRKPAARALLEEYRRNDRLAMEAVRADIARAMPSPPSRSYRNLRLAATGAVLAAAAMVALSFLPLFYSGGQRVVRNAPLPSRSPLPPAVDGYLVDYQDVDYGPRRRQGDVYRDLIGIRGRDPNVIYVFERRTNSSRVVPISGDF